MADALVETITYRVIVVHPDSRTILARAGIGGYRLPCVCIPQWTRPAEQLQKAMKATWGLHVLVLEFLTEHPGFACCAVAQLLVNDASSDMLAVTLDKITSPELSDEQHTHLALLLSGYSRGALTRVGWIDEAIRWLEQETGRTISSKSAIKQYNAGGSFALIRFRTDDNHYYWLKATGEPNAHELPITCVLSRLCGECLPELISSRADWNAWLMSGEARPLVEIPIEPLNLQGILEKVAVSMVDLQMKTCGHGLELRVAGAFDQGVGVLRKRSSDLFDFIEEAMALQTSTKVPVLEKQRIREIRTIVEHGCRRVEDLDLPETIVHGDLNRGNILISREQCQFIDWSEAYVGNPLIMLQHLLLLNKVENERTRYTINCVVKQKYTSLWGAMCDPGRLDRGLAYMPLLAVVSVLYGRGKWLSSSKRSDPRWQAYARSLARHMDRATRESRLPEALCH